MENFLRVLKAIIWMFLIGFSGCSTNLEQDARKLADLQKQKNEKVKEILLSNSSDGKVEHLDELYLLELDYTDFWKQCKIKYSDSLQNYKFQEAFKQSLTNN
jgi:hypothetical protein